jgi:hypothetical protein
MKHNKMRKVILAVLLAAILIIDAAAWVPPAAAQVNPVNALVGFFRVLNAINRRNRIYRAARDAQSDFNSYYGSLQDTARDQLTSGELQSFRMNKGELSRSRAAAYIRLSAALQAEQAAITRAIDAETNQARRNFNRTLVRQLQSLITQLPGAQRILGDVRAAISAIRSTVVSLQTAAAANQPIDLLTQRLAEQVSNSTNLQERVRNLGSALGPELDRRLGSALTQVNQSITDINREANQTIQLLDTMDTQIVQLDPSQAEPTTQEVTIGPVNIRLTDRATAVLDVASQALAVLSAAHGTRGITREQLYQQIRTDLLNERNAALLNAIQRVNLIECKAVDWGTYAEAAAALGITPTIAGDYEAEGGTSYMVCSSRKTGEPIRVWVIRVTATGTAPAAANSPQTEASRTPRQDTVFSLDDCSCSGVSVTFDPDESSASRGPFSLTTVAGTQFESLQQLNCEWSQEYKSDQVTALKQLVVDIYALPTEAEGEILFQEEMAEASSHLPYCEEDHTCTAELLDSTGRRYFHVEKTIFESGGQHLPSSHYAYLVRFETTPEGEAYVINIVVYLPELDPGSSLAADTALALESCALQVINH